MNTLEILMVINESIGWIFMIPAFMGCVYFIVMFSVSDEKAGREFFKKTWGRATAITIIGFIGCSLPSVEDLWKVRIGMIKLQLASPENIQKGADVIERLGAKLECKYLGCEEKKEEKPN